MPLVRYGVRGGQSVKYQTTIYTFNNEPNSYYYHCSSLLYGGLRLGLHALSPGYQGEI